MPFEVYSSLISTLVNPRKIVLNYSGESTTYPALIPAIQRARETGAFVELVSVLAAAPESLLLPLSRSGLNRLTVSVHATDPAKFQSIYRHSSWAALRSRLEQFVAFCKQAPYPPIIDIAFVAMDSNLNELSSVAALAERLELRDVTVFPVLRRDNIPAEFAGELNTSGAHRAEFEVRLRTFLRSAAQEQPTIRFNVGATASTAGERRLGHVPVPYPWPLPEGASIHTCDQNPWETAHVLSNGDVVACEVLDKNPLGSLLNNSMQEIWHGEAYNRFRARYRAGEIPECRTCLWKRAYRPVPPESEVIAARGSSAQLLYGWHEAINEDHIWSSQEASAILEPRSGSRTLHVSGMLPPGRAARPNHLWIYVNGIEVGCVSNPWEEATPIGLDFPVRAGERAPWVIEFRTKYVYRPSECNMGTDQRDLGFALVLLVSKPAIDVERVARTKEELQSLVRFIRRMDERGTSVRRFLRSSTHCFHGSGAWNRGMSVLIPEWDNVVELAACLASVEEAARRWTEPVEIIVIVNGSPEGEYDQLRKRYPNVRWRFFDRQLGFGRAIKNGLKLVQYDAVYLLNSDVILESPAFKCLAPLRRPNTFSVGSQIFYKDRTRFRDETNWTTLFIESGLATIHDWIPRSERPVPTFYSGGGASLFQTRLLKKVLDATAYYPFYWEDVEWGWRARKMGYESWYCPDSVAHHTRRATIGRHYSSDAIASITCRNRLLFQLRNFTHLGSIDRVIEEISEAPPEVGAYFLELSTRWKIARGRLWNYLTGVEDEEVLRHWNESVREE
jgi:GT2 family glycosyltransferase/MoaA/NifB/PqqE/SkfB family radical SAM enzyme